MTDWKKIYRQREAAMGYVPTTLCELCENACGGCRWSQKDVQEPVDGWEAVRRDLPGEAGRLESYVVLECPEYEPETRHWFWIINWDRALAEGLARMNLEEVDGG